MSTIKANELQNNMNGEEKMSDDESDGVTAEAMDSGAENPFAVYLPKPRPFNRTILELYELLNTEYMDLSPPYQREIVWPRKNMEDLVNSLLSNFYECDRVGILLIVGTSGHLFHYGEGKRAGQAKAISRLRGRQAAPNIYQGVRTSSTALKIRFMDGDIGFRQPGRALRYYYVNNERQQVRKRMLPPEVKRRFEDTELLCIEYQGLTSSDQEELFSRVQNGMPLRPAEKMQGTSGPLQDLIREVLAGYPTVKDRITSPQRARDFQMVAFVVFALKYVDRMGDAAKLHFNTSTVNRFLEKHGDKCDENFRERIHRLFTIFENITTLFPQTFAPRKSGPQPHFLSLEWLGTGLLIDRYYTTPVEALNDAICEIRSAVRRKPDDNQIRKRMTTWQLIWKTILDLEERSSSTEDEPLSKRARA